MKSKVFLLVVFFVSFLFSCSPNKGQIEQLKLIPVKSGELFQYIDSEGKIVINPQFAYASVFKEGLALVKIDGDRPLWGFISPNGKFEINAQYYFASDFSEGLAWVMQDYDSPPSVINKKGEFVFSMPDAKRFNVFKEGLAAFAIIDEEGTSRWGFVDKTGKIIINPQFASVGFFREKKCAVMNEEGKWGYIDKEGRLTINYQFDSALGFEKGRAIVKSGDQYGVIDKDGKYVFNPQFSSIIADGNSYLIEQNGKWGWSDKTGKIFINPQFTSAFPFLGNNLAPVESNGKFGFVDKNGKLIINPQFEVAYPFNGKISLVKSSGKYGFINLQGLFAINPQFEDVPINLINYLSVPNIDYLSNTFGLIPGGSLQVNRRVEKIKSGEFDKWSVYLEAGKNYQIDMMSDDFDTIIVLLDNKENYINEDDDGGSGSNSRLRFRPNVSSIYVIYAASYNKEATGGYSIQVQER